eukprot:15277593-Ditylum_brightwellii.AAC.1
MIPVEPGGGGSVFVLGGTGASGARHVLKWIHHDLVLMAKVLMIRRGGLICVLGGRKSGMVVFVECVSWTLLYRLARGNGE